MHYQTENRKAFYFDSALAVFVFLSFMFCIPSPAPAAERRTIIWRNDAGTLKQLDQACLACGILSGDVFRANGYTTENLPPDGELLLVPESKSAVLSTWMDVQAGKNKSSGSIVSVKLHGVPIALRKNPESQDPASGPEIPPRTSENDSTQKKSTGSPAGSSSTSIDVVSARPVSRDAAPDSRAKKERFMPSENEPLVSVKLHGRPTFLITEAGSGSADKKSSPLSKDLFVDTRSADAKPSAVRTASRDLPPVAAASPDQPALVASGPAPIKNMRLFVSGDELIILASSDSRVLRKEAPPLNPEANLSPLDLIPPAQPPLAPTPGTFVAPGKMAWPVSGKVSSGFGKRGKRHFHTGLDLPMPKGTPIQAAMDGVVLETCSTQNKKYRGYGNAVLIEHANGLVTMYAHCLKVNVKPGQKIKQGDIIGLVGNSGRTTTWHVHFEIRKNGKPIDPSPYMAKRI